MTSLTSTLARYVASDGALGTGGPRAKRNQRLPNRAALLQQLSADIGDTKTVLAVWLGMNLAVFVLLCAALLLRIAQPYVVVSGGCVSLFVVMRRVENVWREMRQQQLAVNLALSCRDEGMLRELMLNLNAAILLDAKARASLLQREAGSVPTAEPAASARE